MLTTSQVNLLTVTKAAFLLSVCFRWRQFLYTNTFMPQTTTRYFWIRRGLFSLFARHWVRVIASELRFFFMYNGSRAGVEGHRSWRESIHQVFGRTWMSQVLPREFVRTRLGNTRNMADSHHEMKLVANEKELTEERRDTRTSACARRDNFSRCWWAIMQNYYLWGFPLVQEEGFAISI